MFSLKNAIFNSIIKYAILITILLISLSYLNSNKAYAISIDDAIDIAISKSIEVQIESKKTELYGLSRFDATTTFLPNVNYNYRDGKRKTEVNNSQSKQDDIVKSINISQPLFDGFSSVAKVTESLYQTKSAKQNLNFKKNEIAFQIADIYCNILKYQRIIKINDLLEKDYNKLTILAKQRLLLKDITYSEFSNHELRARKNKIEASQDKITLQDYELKFFKITNEKPLNLSYPKIADEDFILDDLIAISISENPKVKSTKLNHEAKKAAIASEGGKLLPKVSLNMQYENQKSSYYLNGQHLINKSIYLNVAIPIFQSGTEYSAIVKAYKEKQIANLERKQVLQEIEKEVNIQYQKLISLKDNLSILENALSDSSKSLLLAKSKFDKKDIGMMEYLIERIDAAQIEKQLITIRNDYLVSYYNLKSLINEIIATK